jgi:hypothetical protein
MGELRVNVSNFITVGLIALIWVFAAKWAVGTFAPSYSKYV